MAPTNPPKWANWLVEKLCPPSKLEEVQGDLHEAYLWRVEEFGARRAKFHFVMEAIRSSHITQFKPLSSLTQKIVMQKNYLKTGWRFIKKNKLYSSLNIFGMALGISFCWLAYLYANDEMNYDKHLTDHERLYRITIDIQTPKDVHYIGGSSNAMSVQFMEKIPEIEALARFKTGYGMIQKGEEMIGQSYIQADQAIIGMLDMEFLEGASGAFDQPSDVIISETLAGKLNLRGKAVGEILSINGGDGFEKLIIRGVYKDIPLNTSVRRHMIVSYANYLATAPERRLTQWFDINMNSLVKLHDPSTRAAVHEKMDVLHLENEEEMDDKVSITLQPISQIHLNKDYGHYNGISRGGNVGMIRLFAGIGLFCLIISMINYSNFTISLYINRAREVALRKVIGAQKSGIFNQLITESFLSCFIAGILALLVMIAILPFFSDFVVKNYDLSFLINGRFIVGALIILIIASLLSGVYPALVLSRFSIIKSLKGEQKIRSGKWITQSLLAIQFIIATTLVAGMLTMQAQVKYLTTFDTKINHDNVVYMDYIPAEESQIKSFMSDLDQVPEVAEVAAISGYNGTRFTFNEEDIDVRHLRVDRDLTKLLDIEIISGRNFDSEIISDQSQSILINETLAKKLGFEQPIGEVIPFKYGDLVDPMIIGVVEDYHFESAQNTVDPLVIYQAEAYPLQSVYIRLGNASIFNQEKFEAVWSKHFDPFPFEYAFLEETYKAAYNAENRAVKLVGIGCFISIILAAVGLLGIVGLQLNQRFKEISIRKVLGASSASLYSVFTKRYILIIASGLVVGLFLGNFVIEKWLSNYPYHVDFGARIIFITIISTMSIGLLTIISQVFKVVKANPVRFLRDE